MSLEQTNKLKILNDPIYGFIAIPNALIFDLIEHSYFQRLRRISQVGLSYLVYPGAHHTRFHHAIGCMFLMQKAVQTLTKPKELRFRRRKQQRFISLFYCMILVMVLFRMHWNTVL